MDELAGYIYAYGPLCWALLAGFGGLVVTLSKKRLRQARAFFVLSAIPLFMLPIIFGWTARAAVAGLTIATISAVPVGMIYYWGISILNEHIKDAQKSDRSIS